MLKQQHQFAAKITNSGLRQEYKMHMCGLCHALGDNYGLLYRLLTSHEMILLSMLINAQRIEEPLVVNHRCPLNPLKEVCASQGVANEFASSAAIGLAKVSAEDGLQDSKPWSLSARFLDWIQSRVYPVALANLAGFGFETELLTQLTMLQTDAQEDKAQDPSQPTAMVSARLFATTAKLAGNDKNASVLAEIGLAYGEYVYLMDALRDYPKDMQRGNYNPLREFSECSKNSLVLSPAGLEWLLKRFTALLSIIQSRFVYLQVYRYEGTLNELLCKPIQATVTGLATRLDHDKKLVFGRWQYADMLRAAAFIMPIVAISAKSIDPQTLKDAIEHLPPGTVSDSCNVIRTGAESAQLSIASIIGEIDWLARILDFMPLDKAGPSLCEACAQDCTDCELYKSTCECATADSGCNLV